MALNNTQTNFGYDHASYLARGTWNATIAAGSGSTLKFVAHANLQLMAVTATLVSGPETVVIQSGWRDIEGTPRLFTAAEILTAQQSLLAFGAACDAVSQVIAAEIDAAETEEAVDTLLGQIPTDPRWPADS